MTIAGRAVQRVEHAVGGRPRTQVIITLGAVLALSAADTSTVGAAGPQLQHAFGIGRPAIGVLLAASSLVGAVATLPAGMLVDRKRRVSLLLYAVILWGATTALSGLATSFGFLLATRIMLGVVVAVAAPAVASLVGDFFPERERGRIYGYVLGGELIGTGFGFVVAGDLAALSWRAAFFCLAPPAAALAYALTKLPEPERGGSSRLPDGARSFDDAEVSDTDGSSATEHAPAIEDALRHIEPRRENVLRTNPRDMSLLDAMRYVLRVRSNVVLIVSSALGYFFLAGVRGFGVDFVRHNYSVPQATATTLALVIGVGLLVGILNAGRIADRMLARGRLNARITVAAVALLSATAVFIPALLTSNLMLAMPLLLLCGIGMGGSTPPLDAARLDVMPSGLWGRAEAVRTVLQGASQGGAPIVFGIVASDLFGGKNGLRDAFLIALVPLAASAVLLLTSGRRNYPKDAATAAASSTNARGTQARTSDRAEALG